MKHEKKGTNGRLDYAVYHFVFETAVEISEEIFEVSKCFPREKNYLINQVRRHSRLVCTNLAEAWRVKEEDSIFVNKLSDAAQAASKTQTCLELASKHNFIGRETFQKLDSKYEDIFELLCDGTKHIHQRIYNYSLRPPAAK